MEHELELWDLNRNVQQILERLESIETMLRKESMGYWESKWNSTLCRLEFRCSKCGAIETRRFHICPTCYTEMLGVK